jgi:maltose phosphorylase
MKTQSPNDELKFSPKLPKQWKSYAFNVLFRDKVVNVKVNSSGVEITA